jgi:uncharacterized protein YyaL (SSP411 family)
MVDNRLAAAVSPYLRLHAGNPVDWREWGADAFAEATARDLPVLVSIGYSTCHWCHVMARESFEDPDVAEILRQGFVSIKVDREERPDVDASAMAAAAAFTESLGWPLTVFMTPDARVFFAGTYYPPTQVGEHPSFRQVLAAITDAWTNRRDEVNGNAGAIAEALRTQRAHDQGDGRDGAEPPLPDESQIRAVAVAVERAEDTEFGGFGTAPKFPNAPLLEFLVDAGTTPSVAARTIDAIAASELRDNRDGGIFRYATHRDWSVPHYERMLYDNAGLLAVAARTGRSDVARGIATFLRDTLRVHEGPLAGAFVAAQDSESTIDGKRVEGEWYRRPDRELLEPPPLDDQVLTGWNGLAIRGLAIAGALFDDDMMIGLASDAADAILAEHVTDGRVTVRASTPRGRSAAPPQLEDIGLLAEGLVELALATGDVRYAAAARELVDHAGAGLNSSDPLLAAAGTDVGEQPQTALRSGTVGLATASMLLGVLSGDDRYHGSALELVGPGARAGVAQPLGHADALGLAIALQRPSREIVVVTPEGQDADAGTMRMLATNARKPGTVVAIVTQPQARAWATAGFELFEGRDLEAPAAYVCHDRVCDLPARTPAALGSALLG